jgi:hypothetical protein
MFQAKSCHFLMLPLGSKSQKQLPGIAVSPDSSGGGIALLAEPFVEE